MNFKLRNKSKASFLSNSRHSSILPTHHYLHKQSSKIFNNSPQIDLDKPPKSLLTSDQTQQQLPYGNLVNIWKEATRTKSLPNKSNENRDLITVNGITGIWVNKEECLKWNGPVPLEQYRINQDANPIIVKKRQSVSEPVQEISFRYLKPTRLADAGDLILKEDDPVYLPPAPPIILRQISKHNGPRIIREKPPNPPKPVPVQTITIPGKILEPPKRQIIIERVYENSAPQEIILERWLSYPKQKRNIVFQPCQNDDMTSIKAPDNIIIDWEFDEFSKELTDSSENKQQNIEYSVQTVDPNEYENKYVNELLDSNRFSDLISQYEIPQGETLAADLNEDEEKRFILTGSIEALNLIDKNRDDFNKYLYAKF